MTARILLVFEIQTNIYDSWISDALKIGLPLYKCIRVLLKIFANCGSNNISPLEMLISLRTYLFLIYLSVSIKYFSNLLTSLISEFIL